MTMPTWSTCFSVGDRARLSFSVKTTGSSYADTAVTMVVRPPTGPKWVQSCLTTAGTATIKHDSKGHWHADYPVAEAGRHVFAFRSTGTVNATTSGAFTARAVPSS